MHVILCRSCSTRKGHIPPAVEHDLHSVRYVRTYLTPAEKVMYGKLRFLVPAQMYIYIDQVKLCHAYVSLVFYNPI